VNKWLLQNGDPRTVSIRWIYWIESIPFYQTKYYVQRVLENAVVYETLHPDKAPGGRARGLSQFLR
jgi:soluble lytic murein transglycosylase